MADEKTESTEETEERAQAPTSDPVNPDPNPESTDSDPVQPAVGDGTSAQPVTPAGAAPVPTATTRVDEVDPDEVADHPLTKQAEEGNKAAIDAREEDEGESDEDYEYRVSNVPGVFGDRTSSEIAALAQPHVPARAEVNTPTGSQPVGTAAAQPVAPDNSVPAEEDVKEAEEAGDNAEASSVSAPGNEAAEARGSVENPSAATSVPAETPVVEDSGDESSDKPKNGRRTRKSRSE